MNTQALHLSLASETVDEIDYDTTLSLLIAQITRHSLEPTEDALSPIVDTIESLLNHPDLEFYPEQQRVLVKLRKLWLMVLSRQHPQH